MTFGAEPSSGGRRGLEIAALVLAVAAALLLLARGGLSAHIKTMGGSSLTPATASQQARCGQWAATHALGGGCLARLDSAVGKVPCCGGEGYTCSDCPIAKLQALHCVSPRHLLLQAAPGCSIAKPQACIRLSAADTLQGRWVNASDAAPGPPGTPPLLFQPASDAARGPPMGAAEALQRIWGAGYDRVVVSGDSTVRHVYNRLVGLLRQQEHVIDGGGIAHAHYRLRAWDVPGSGHGNDGGGGSRWLSDELWFSPPANFEKGNWDESIMADGLAELMRRSFPADDPLSSDADSSGGGSGSSGEVGRGLTLDFVIGAKAAWQQPHVRSYLAVEGLDGGAWRRRALLLLSVCVWEQTQVFRSGWLEFVEEVRQQVGQVALLTCPTDRIRRKQHAEGRKLVAQRNKRLRAMVARGRGGDADPTVAARDTLASDGGSGGQQEGAVGRISSSNGTGKTLLLMDLDAITQRLPLKPELGVAPIDFHYQCMLSSTTTYNGTGPIRWAGGDGSPVPTYPTLRYDQLLRPPADTCSDPVGYAGWELLLGMLCTPEQH